MNQNDRQVELTKWTTRLTTGNLKFAECLELREVLTRMAAFVDYAYRENRRLAKNCNRLAGFEEV